MNILMKNLKTFTMKIAKGAGKAVKHQPDNQPTNW